MEIRSVDVHDDEQLRAWYDVYRACALDERDYPTAWTWPETVAAFRRPDKGNRRDAVVGEQSGGTVAASILVYPLLDNTHAVYAETAVLAQWRRRGIGTAMVDDIVQRSRTAGRRTVIAEVVYPFDAAEDHPFRAFARRLGFVEALSDVHRILDLPVDDPRIDRLLARATPRHRDYRIVTWLDRCPDEFLEGFGELYSALVVEAPMGDLELEEEVWDAERLRENEETRKAQGRSTFAAAAVASDGSLAGYTELVVPQHDPGQVYQWGTLVRRAHRGHHLGLALKSVNLRVMQQACPHARVVHTWNADVNAAMIAVNEAMGFRPVERLGEFQREL